MDISESLNFAQERLDKISYNLEMTNKLPCRPFYEKQQDMLIKAISAMKKQIPLKPIGEPHVWPDGLDYVKMLCPKCKEEVSRDERHCSECGQHLDWSENDG